MNWYGAHIISYVKFTDGKPQETYPLWENIVLINAESDDAAFTEAERIGKSEYDGDSLEWGGRPAVWTFGGVRRLVICQDKSDRIEPPTITNNVPDFGHGHGTEITYLQMELLNEQDFQNYLNCESVTLIFDE